MIVFLHLYSTDALWDSSKNYTKQMILFLTFLTGFTSKRVSSITTWLIMVRIFAFFFFFYPLGYLEINCVCFLASFFYKYKVLLPYPVKIFLIYTSVMGLNFKIINLISSLMTSREVFVRLCYFECMYFIFISLF